MARYKLTFSPDAPTDDIVKAVTSAIEGDLKPALKIGEVDCVLSDERTVRVKPNRRARSRK